MARLPSFVKWYDYVLHPLSGHKRWLAQHSRYCQWIKQRNKAYDTRP